MSYKAPAWISILVILGAALLFILVVFGVLFIVLRSQNYEWVSSDTVKDVCEFLIKHRDEMKVNDFAGNFTRLSCARR